MKLSKQVDNVRADRMADLFAPATVVLFAGCGGTCIGIEQAYVDGGYRDKYVDLAINHWDTAVGVHELNHPMTQHLRADVREVDPRSVLLGRKIAYLHASPDCVDFSKAKGSRPKRKHIRGLAWVVIDWAAKRRPDVITLENVEEFRQWGPLGADGQPCKRRRGRTYEQWKSALQGLGYRVEERELRAHKYQTPTTRKRLFVVARCDDRKIIFPARAHWAPEDAPVRTAAECIDWSIPMLSIFATPDEAKAFGQQHGVGTPRRPLKPKTLARIAGGLDKFVIKAAKPFIVRIAHGDESGGGKRWGHASHDVDQPLGTNTGSKDYAIVDATLAPYSVPRYGERDGQAPRCGSVDAPMPTVVGSGNGAQLVAALMTKHYSGATGSSMSDPVDTVTATDHNAVTVAHLMKFRGNSVGTPADEPMPTITSGAGAARNAGAAHAMGVSVAYLSHFYTSNTRGGEGDIRQPAKTITSGGQHAAVTVALASPFLVGTGGAAYAAKPKAADEPANTVMVNDRRAIVAAFLSTYYGNGGINSPAEPMPTVVGKDRIQLVTVTIDGTTYVITDIAMRMLTPRELARAQGFADDYVLDRTSDGTPVSKADQVKLIGNSVPPPFARALAYANVVQQGVLDDAREAVAS